MFLLLVLLSADVQGTARHSPGDISAAVAATPPADSVLLPSRQLLVIELVIVLALSLGRSGIYALVKLIGAATAPGGLSAQTTTMHGSLAPSRPWLDLTFQLLGIVFAVVPVALAGYLLVRSGTSLRDVWFRGAGVGDVGRGAAVAAAVGSVGVAFYLVMHALGLNLTVVADGLPPVWWKFPVLVLSALQNAVLEEFVVLGYVLVRLRQSGSDTRPRSGSSALLRGSYHLYQGIGGFVGNFAMGLLFGWLYRRWVGSRPWWRHTRCSTSGPSSATPCWSTTSRGCPPDATQGSVIALDTASEQTRLFKGRHPWAMSGRVAGPRRSRATSSSSSSGQGSSPLIRCARCATSVASRAACPRC